MHAMNHAVTALVVKKHFDRVSLVWLLISVQVMELAWVALNWAGVEYITTEPEVHTIADVHLTHMPYSHSILGAAMLAGTAWLVLDRIANKPRVAVAVAIGILSHLVLDLLTHVPDIAIAWFGTDVELGTGLYALPIAAFVVEAAYGLAVWRYVRGSVGLLVAIAVFQLGTFSAHVTWLSGIEAGLADNPGIAAIAVATQIAITLPLVYWLGRARPVIPLRNDAWVGGVGRDGDMVGVGGERVR